MDSGTTAAVFVAVAYLVGSVPVGFLIAKLVFGVDLRTTGSGNIGATNVGRTLGAKWGAACLVFDLLKGVVPTLMPLAVMWPSGWRDPLMMACGAAAVVGHVFPVWLGFRGGKGVATGAGVAIVLAWQAAVAAAVMFGIVFFAKRIVSLSSMLAAIVYAVVVIFLSEPTAREDWPLIAFAIAIPALIIVRHRDNIARLLRGEEKPFSTSGRSETSPQKLAE
jgi:glycerol-3-phosphate acyltransferase PlsY